MRSVMSHSFAQVPAVEVPRSSFDRSHGHKTAFDFGQLIPVYVDEALPGDSFNMNTFMFGRLATPLYPVMDNAYLDIHYFAIPLRMIWDNHAKFMGERLNPADSIDYTVPVVDKTKAPVSTTGYTDNSLQDYMGIPPRVASFEHSQLPLRAYNKVYNDWYRDANLIDSVTVDTGDGPDDPADYTILKRGKRHDYFTASLPWLQRGDAMSVPLGTSAPITHDGSGTGDIVTVKAPNIGVSDYNLNAGGTYLADSNNTTGATRVPLYADLSSATAATINQLRQAFQVQRLLERDARGGTGRLHEIIQSHFGVMSLDRRATKSEYLGGTTSKLNISGVANTNFSAGFTSANMGAIGTISEAGGGFTKSFTEHCIILGIASARADLTYQQGLERMWSRSTRYDYFWPVLSKIGEQSILNKEIYLQGSAGGTDDDSVFGYIPRYEEYRYKPSRISGAFRSSHAATLDVWHLSQEFASLPTLGQTFIEETPPVSRVVVSGADPELIVDMYFNLKCARPMPMYGVPGLMDHL
jgi:hypothetical protein